MAEATNFAVAWINIALLVMLFAIGIAIARMRQLFVIVMLSGLYSLISAAWFVALDAVDVAFTEAAVGAGISTALMLGAMLLTVREAKPTPGLFKLAPLAICIATGIVLVYASFGLPVYGDPNAAPIQHVAGDYLTDTYSDIGVPNIVTAVLASYRGFDTLGETGVIFAAGVAVALLIGFGERSLSASRRERDEGEDK